MTRDTVGVMARHVSDVILFDKIFSSCPREYPSVSLEGMRIGFPSQWWAEVGSEAEATFRSALESMRGAGVQLVEVDVGLLLDGFTAEVPDHFFYTYEATRELARYLAFHRLNVSLTDLIARIATPAVQQIYRKMAALPLQGPPSPRDMLRVIATSLPKLSAMWHAYFDVFRFDVMVVPTTPIPSRPICDVQPLSEINGRREVMFSGDLPNFRNSSLLQPIPLSSSRLLCADRCGGVNVGFKFSAKKDFEHFMQFSLRCESTL